MAESVLAECRLGRPWEYGEASVGGPCATSALPSLFPHPCPLQYLMEGSYNKVFLAKGNIPAESYTFFIDILLDTIR